MARPIWTGQISFGLVSIPVTMHSAEKSSELSFHMLDRRNNARVRYERVNEVTGEEVPWPEIVKGYELEDGDYVILTDEDFKRAAPEATQTVDIEAFVPEDDIPPVYFDKPYYLAPGKRGEKGYVLLREVLKKSGKIGVARVVIRSKEHLAALIPQGDVLVLNMLRFEHDLKKPDSLDLPHGATGEHKLSAKEMEMAAMLVDTMSGTWEPRKYHDQYSEKLLKWIHERAKHPERAAEPIPEPRRERSDVINLAEYLQKSLKARGVKGTGARESPGSRRRSKAPARRKAG